MTKAITLKTQKRKVTTQKHHKKLHYKRLRTDVQNRRLAESVNSSTIENSLFPVLSIPVSPFCLDFLIFHFKYPSIFCRYFPK